MTLSILGYDRGTMSVGVCSFTSSPAHGQRCLHFRKNVGVIVTQGKTNRHHGALGIELLALGLLPEECLRTTMGHDLNIQHRQVAIMDSKGRPAVFSGHELKDTKGHLVHDDHVVVGNYLANERVLHACANGFRSAEGELADRLLSGCRAGHQSGGEHGGAYSGFLIVIRPDQMAPWGAHVEIRIDYAANVIDAMAVALIEYRKWEAERLRDPLCSIDGSLPVDALRLGRRADK